MKVTLNIHGTLARFYRAFWNDPDLPNNLCSYFWKLVLAFVLLPICYPMLIINNLCSPYYYEKGNSWSSEGYKGGYNRNSSAYGLLVNVLLVIIGLLVSEWIFGEDSVKYMSIWKVYFNGIIVAISIVTIVLIIIYSTVLIQKLIPKKELKEETEEEITARLNKEREAYLKKEAMKQKSLWYLIKKMFIAWKEKNCPIIEWEK